MPWISWERSAIACRRDTRDRDAHDDDMHYGLWRTVFSSFAVRIEQMKLSTWTGEQISPRTRGRGEQSV
jgi:hypothetical protein